MSRAESSPAPPTRSRPTTSACSEGWESHVLNTPDLGWETLPPKNGFSQTLTSYMHFFLAGLFQREQTGGIVPSQKFLIDKMIAPIPAAYGGRIVELGAGSGALTLRLATRCPRAHILACEINPTLACDTQQNLARAGLAGRVQVVSEAAELVLERLRLNEERVDFVLSGIPLGNLNREQSFKLIYAVHGALAPGGMYIQFQHSLVDRKKIEISFARLRTVPALLNFPPAFIYYAQK